MGPRPVVKVHGTDTESAEADYDRLFGDVSFREKVAHRLAEQIKTTHVGAVVSANTNSMIFASLACNELQLPMAYLRTKAKAHGKQRRFEGRLSAGTRVALLFDRRPQEAVLRDAIEAVEEQDGAQVADYLVISGDQVMSDDLAGAPAAPTLQEAVAGTWDREATARQVAEALLSIGAVTIAAPGHPYEYASGLLSPIYTDNRLLISHPSAWSIIVDGLVGTIRHELHTDIDVVAGVVTSGLPHAADVAARLKLPIIYTASDEEQPRVVGKLLPKQRVLMIEDHVTTGKSVLAAARNIRALDGDLRACLAIFTYDKPQVEAKFAQEQLQFATLCDLPTLLETGQSSGRFGATERDAVLQWVADPGEWTRAHESERPTKPALSS